jgi:hypothetical protein
MFNAGDWIGHNRLTENLGQFCWHVETWRAVDPAVLTDYGMELLKAVVLRAYRGPRHSDLEHLLCWKLEAGESVAARAQLDLAMIYFQLRAGHHLFDRSKHETTTARALAGIAAVDAYLRCGDVEVSSMRAASERAAVTRALSRVPHERFPSCEAFVRALD